MAQDGGPAYMKDRTFYRGVVVVLGIASLGSLGLIGYIAIAHPDADNTALVAIASGCTGALAGIFK